MATCIIYRWSKLGSPYSEILRCGFQVVSNLLDEVLSVQVVASLDTKFVCVCVCKIIVGS